MSRFLTAVVSGGLFAAGLVFSGMVDPAQVRAFLDVTGEWSPRLLFVMGAAVATHAALRFAFRRFLPPAPKPPPGSSGVDGRLIGGAVLFGAGWGLAGYCPGPALVGLSTFTWTPVLFVASMLGAMALFNRLPTSACQFVKQRDATATR